MHTAAKNGRDGAAAVLLEAGADLEGKDNVSGERGRKSARLRGERDRHKHGGRKGG